MKIEAVHYNLSYPSVLGQGLSISEESLNDLISGPITDLVFDSEGNDIIANLLTGVADTEFEKQKLQSILQTESIPEDWRVGEAIAEHYFTEEKECLFPWPDGRDERKRNSSLPGADLVGFKKDDESSLFAFGEVKTSADNNYPPNVSYGRHGIKQQLEDLRDNEEIRDDLVKYLGHRASNSNWQELYITASSRYLKDSCDVYVFGSFIRDVNPDEADIKVRVEKLSQACPNSMSIEFIAIYLPPNSISDLGKMVLESNDEEDDR